VKTFFFGVAPPDNETTSSAKVGVFKSAGRNYPFRVEKEGKSSTQKEKNKTDQRADSQLFFSGSCPACLSRNRAQNKKTLHSD
jgi:hypothetical protein